MCRLYGLQATHPTRAACELLDAQNALIRQSRQDQRGLSNPHGWGMGHVADGETHCFRQVKPASESPQYREEALRTEGTTVLAHVRRATVGEPSRTNTHPFRHGPAMLIHNGHVPAFEAVRKPLLEVLSKTRRRSIGGTTDSEHVLALLLHLRDEHPEAPLWQITRAAVERIQSWVREADPRSTVDPADVDTESLSHEELARMLGLNLLWTDGSELAGSRLNRSLWTLERSEPRACPICETQHARPPEHEAYRASVLASERITDEDWTELPNGSVFSVSTEGRLRVEPMATKG
jgi:glutamine amidotransferase